MQVIPAFCGICGTAFPSGLAIGGQGTANITNCTSGPCPNCGGGGRIIDGIYSLTENALKLFTSPGQSKEQLQVLFNILSESKNHRHSPQQITEAIHKNAPEYDLIAAAIASIKHDPWVFIGVLISALGVIISCLQNNTPLTKITVESVLNTTTNNTYIVEQSPKQTTSKKPKIGRNTQCPCGSGKKYKKCCGK